MNKKTSKPIPNLLDEVEEKQIFEILLRIFMPQLKGKTILKMEIDCDPGFYFINVLSTALSYWIRTNIVPSFPLKKCLIFGLQNFKFEINDYQQNTNGSVTITAKAIKITEN